MTETIEQAVDIEAQAPKKSRKRFAWIIGLSVLGLLLAGAAFLAGRLFNGTLVAGPGLNLVNGGGEFQAARSIQIEMGDPLEELPKTTPDTTGLFSKRDGNVITLIGGENGGASMVVVSGEDGGMQISQPDGPAVEVVVTKDTKLYRDATFDDLEGGPPEEGQKIQQKVAEGSLDEMTNTSMVTVWGRKSGDRIIADVILFSSPMVFRKGE
jgi:hypothetical protein